MASEDKKRVNSLLEVEDSDARQARLERLFSSISLPTSRPSTVIPPISERKTFSVPPPSNLLARLEAFLPEIKAANEELVGKAAIVPSGIDIKSVEDNDGDSEDDDEDDDSDEDVPPKEVQKPYIEMNLGLGVFEQRPTDSDAQQPATDSDSAESETSEDDDEEDEDVEMSDSDLQKKEPLASVRPNITVLDDRHSGSEAVGRQNTKEV